MLILRDELLNLKENFNGESSHRYNVMMIGLEQIYSKTGIQLTWREGGKAPCWMDRCCNVVIGRDTVYFYDRVSVHAYNTTTFIWSLIPECPIFCGFAIAIIDRTLTAIGGYDSDIKVTNKIFSLTGTEEEGGKRWTEEFPPMPSKRCYVSALYTGTALIVAGGKKDTGILSIVTNTVEVLNTSTRQWRTATKLPQPTYFSSITVCGDRVYLLGGCGEDCKWTSSVYSCSLTILLPSVCSRLVRALSRSIDAWTRVADLPVSHSTAVSLHGQLIAVGGRHLNHQPTSAIHRYDHYTN